MGARAGYTLATALFVGAVGVLGCFEWIFYLLPKAVVFPILIFVGLEITAQSFRATPRRHYPALALACVPALAYLAQYVIKQMFGASGKPFADFPKETQQWMQTITILAGGFIVTSLLWGTALARLIDGRARAAAATFLLAGAFSLFGVIHSPLPSGPIVTPWEARRLLADEGRLAATLQQTPYHWGAAYLAMALVALAVGRYGRAPSPEAYEEPRAI
jgi:adenine/guanine/hypoxanthine permease